MYCSQCGREIDDDSKFCEYCGAPVPAMHGASPVRTEEETRSEAASVAQAEESVGADGGMVEAPEGRNVGAVPENDSGATLQEVHEEAQEEPLDENLDEAPDETGDEDSNEVSEGNSKDGRKSKKRRGIIAVVCVAIVAVIAVGAAVGYYLYQKQAVEDARIAAELEAQRLHEITQVVTVVVDAPGYDEATSSSVPVHIVGTDNNGTSVDETLYLTSATEQIELRQGDYELTAAGSPVTADGGLYTCPKTSVELSVGEDGVFSQGVDVGSGPGNGLGESESIRQLSSTSDGASSEGSDSSEASSSDGGSSEATSSSEPSSTDAESSVASSTADSGVKMVYAPVASSDVTQADIDAAAAWLADSPVDAGKAGTLVDAMNASFAAEEEKRAAQQRYDDVVATLNTVLDSYRSAWKQYGGTEKGTGMYDQYVDAEMVSNAEGIEYVFSDLDGDGLPELLVRYADRSYSSDCGDDLLGAYGVGESGVVSKIEHYRAPVYLQGQGVIMSIASGGADSGGADYFEWSGSDFVQIASYSWDLEWKSGISIYSEPDGYTMTDNGSTSTTTSESERDSFMKKATTVYGAPGSYDWQTLS